jgi:hypothetical protein
MHSEFNGDLVLLRSFKDLLSYLFLPFLSGENNQALSDDFHVFSKDMDPPENILVPGNVLSVIQTAIHGGEPEVNSPGEGVLFHVLQSINEVKNPEEPLLSFMLFIEGGAMLFYHLSHFLFLPVLIALGTIPEKKRGGK